jgi:hypothetical protein
MDYLARVDLHGVRTDDEYAVLHAELAKAKFFTVIIGGNNNTSLHLPAGTYYCYGTYLDVNTAHRAVASVLRNTPFKGSVIVVAVAAWQSSDLPPL